MQCGKTNLNKLEKLQERALATVYRDRSLTYDVMLKMSGQLGIRMNLVRLLAIEIFKSSQVFFFKSSNFLLQYKRHNNHSLMTKKHKYLMFLCHQTVIIKNQGVEVHIVTHKIK